MLPNKAVALACALFTLLAAPAALAYVGPGAGLSLLGALWGLVAAIGAALLFIVAWPFRRMFRHKRKNSDAQDQGSGQTREQHSDEGQQHDPATDHSR